MQDGQTGHTLERRGRQIIILPAGTHADVRIRIVRIDHRVLIRAVTVIRRPHLRNKLGMSHHRDDPCQKQ